MIAGPGTGKTRTLVSRIGYLIRELHITSAHITAVTFTNKAAAEMRERCSAMLSERTVRNLTIGTFHGICLQLLREHEPGKNITILDDFTAVTLMRELIDEYGISAKAPDLLRTFSQAKTREDPIDASLEKDMLRWYTLYQQKCSAFGAVDFSDLLLNTLNLLRAKAVSEHSLKRFGYLLVDEFQDINAIQYELVKQWMERTGNCFIIGDPHQAIYGFRGASPKFFKRFGNDFPQTRYSVLTRNYRSIEAVVESAKNVIRNNTDAAELPVQFSAVDTDRSAIRMVTTRNEAEEARFIAATINQLVGGVDMLDAHRYAACSDAGDRSYGFSDIAVLYRTHRQAEVLERCLVQEGIACRISGRDSALNTQSVAVLIAVIKLVVNPDDVASFMIILHHYNVSTDYALQYAAGMRTHERLYTILDRFLLNTVTLVMKQCKEVIHAGTPAELLSTVSTAMGFQDDEAVLRFIQIAELSSDIHSLLAMWSLGSDADWVRNGFGRPHGEAVQLSTLHAAKGLEFPVTFICGINDGVLPHRNAKGEYADIEEERRLFYVGITRAKKQLICTATRKRSLFGKISNVSVSRFIKEIDEKYIISEEYRLEPVVTQMSLF